MGALAQVYVDPSRNANIGVGTSGDPYGDLQYALETHTRDATNGTQINIKAGTAEVLAAPLSFTTFTSPTNTSNPTVFRGYTSTAGDGGIGVINGNGGAVSSGQSFTNWYDLEIHNGGSATIIDTGSNCTIRNCKIHNTSGIGINLNAAVCLVIQCEITDCGEGVVAAAANCFIEYNYFKFGGTRNFTTATRNVVTGHTRWNRNIFSIGTSGNAIYIAGVGGHCIGNSILANGSTGYGIQPNTTSRVVSSLIMNNVVEGFSGGGGMGFNWTSATNKPIAYSGNAAYGNTTDYANVGDMGAIENVDNEVLSASPFAKSGSDTFANRFVYFAPADTGNIRGGAIQ